MTVPLLYVAPDGSNDETLWRRTDDWRQCIPIARRCDVSESAWSLLLAGAAVANGADPLDICADCADPIPEGEGCNCLERYCGACFVWHCASCRADMKDDLAAEGARDR